MWPLASTLLKGSLVASLEDIAKAIRLMVERNRVVAEGAGKILRKRRKQYIVDVIEIVLEIQCCALLE
jgi:hypothetical protein